MCPLALRFPAAGHLLDMARYRPYRLTGHGAGHPLLRAGRAGGIAYATVGEGPLLLFSARWVSHLEEEWEDPRARDVLRGVGPAPTASCATTGSGRVSPTVSFPDLRTMEIRGPGARDRVRRPAAANRRSCSLARAPALATVTLCRLAAPDLVRKVVFFAGGTSRVPTSQMRRGDLARRVFHA